MSLAAIATSSRSCATYSSPALLRCLLRRIQNADYVRRELGLTRARTLHLGLAGEIHLDGGKRRLRISARGADKTGGCALLVIQQRFQQMLGSDALVELADGDGLRSLHESAGSVR